MKILIKRLALTKQNEKMMSPNNTGIPGPFDIPIN